MPYLSQCAGARVPSKRRVGPVRRLAEVRGSRPPLSYTTAAHVLIQLAASPDGVVHSGAADDPVRRVLRIAAEACELVEQARADREAALLYATELRSLLNHVSGLLDAQPLPMEGGTWDGYMLAQRARHLLQDEPTTAGHALRDELHSARIVARAAAALVAARQEGDAARTRMCEQVLYRAIVGHKAAPASEPIGPSPPRLTDIRGPEAL